MALFRNISGVTNDVYSLKCDDAGNCDYMNNDTRSVDVIEYYRPVQSSGVFPEITQYPIEPLPNNQPGIQTTEVVNMAPVLPVPPVDTSMDKKKPSAGALLLAACGVALYMGMTKKENNTETMLYLGGIAALFLIMNKKQSQTTPVTE